MRVVYLKFPAAREGQEMGCEFFYLVTFSSRSRRPPPSARLSFRIASRRVRLRTRQTSKNGPESVARDTPSLLNFIWARDDIFIFFCQKSTEKEQHTRKDIFFFRIRTRKIRKKLITRDKSEQQRDDDNFLTTGSLTYHCYYCCCEFYHHTPQPLIRRGRQQQQQQN